MMKRCPDQGGFSLIELMIAIGILAVGAAMVASAFPVAMMENKESVEHTMAALISEDALAICRNKLRHSVLNNSVAIQQDKYTDVTENITLAEAAYPMPRLKDETPGDTSAERAANWAKIKAKDWMTVAGSDYPTARYGWMVGARQIRDAESVRLNDYELSIVVYEKFLPKDRPGHEIKLDSSCKKVNYAADGATVAPNSRDPTIGCWVVRVSLRP